MLLGLEINELFLTCAGLNFVAITLFTLFKGRALKRSIQSEYMSRDQIPSNILKVIDSKVGVNNSRIHPAWLEGVKLLRNGFSAQEVEKVMLFDLDEKKSHGAHQIEKLDSFKNSIGVSIVVITCIPVFLEYQSILAGTGAFITYLFSALIGLAFSSIISSYFKKRVAIILRHEVKIREIIMRSLVEPQKQLKKIESKRKIGKRNNSQMTV